MPSRRWWRSWRGSSWKRQAASFRLQAAGRKSPGPLHLSGLGADDEDGGRAAQHAVGGAAEGGANEAAAAVAAHDYEVHGVVRDVVGQGFGRRAEADGHLGTAEGGRAGADLLQVLLGVGSEALG